MKATHPPGHASPLSLFKNRFVQAIMVAGLFMQLGIWIRNFAVLLYVVEMTNKNATAVSLVSVAEFAPIFIFSFIGGTFADRWRPKRTMVWCDILSAASVFTVLLTIMMGSWQAVFFTTFVSAILSQFSQPSSMKLFKHHVPEDMMQAGMSIFQTMVAVFMVLGPGVGTFIFQKYGITVSLIVTGIAFLLSALALTFLPPDKVEENQTNSGSTVGKELAAGFRYVMNSSLLKSLGACFALAGLALGLIQPMAIFLVTERLQLPESYLSVLLMVNGAAMFVGGALSMVFGKKFKPQQMLVFGMFISSISMVIGGWSTVLWLTLISQLIGGLVLPSIQIGISTLILKNTEPDFIGRVNGILSPMFIGSMVITMAVSGILKEALSLVPLYGIASVLFILGVAVMIPTLRMREPESGPTSLNNTLASNE